MPRPNFVSLPWLKLKELETGRVLNVMMQVSPASILLFFSYERGDDIEVALGIEDCKQIRMLFQRALEADAGTIQQSDQPLNDAIVHRFKNLDGSADAALRIARRQESVEISVERADEGGFEFTVSTEDAGKLLDFLDSALEFSIRFPSP
jgi:hypothetical protein